MPAAQVRPMHLLIEYWRVAWHLQQLCNTYGAEWPPRIRPFYVPCCYCERRSHIQRPRHLPLNHLRLFLHRIGPRSIYETSTQQKLLRKCETAENALFGPAADQVKLCRTGRKQVVRIAARTSGRERRWKMRLVRAGRQACQRWKAW